MGSLTSGLRFTQDYRSAADTARLDELLSRAELTVLDAILDKLDQWGEELRSDHKRASIVHPVCPTPVGSAVDRSRCVARRALYGRLPCQDILSRSDLSTTRKRAASPPVTTRWSKVSDNGSTRRTAG